MKDCYIVRAGKMVTVSEHGTVHDGAMVVQNGKIKHLLDWSIAQKLYPTLPVLDFSNYVITPSLVDCHTHLLEFAPGSLHPVTPETQLHTGKSIILQALMSGITAFGEQICGHPASAFSISDYKNCVKDLPVDIAFAATSISIGFKELAHFTSVTAAKPVDKQDLINRDILTEMARQNDYPGENLFLNATPANFTKDMVPRAGELIYTKNELSEIADLFHSQGKEIGIHVAGSEGIDMALDAGIDVLHHAHGITDQQLQRAAKQGTKIIATPLGGTHVEPNSPDNIVKLIKHNIETSVATDAYLPPYPDVEWLPYDDSSLKGPDVLMEIAHPSMKKLAEDDYDENDILALITANPAKLLGKGDQFGRLDHGMDATFIASEGIPGLQITNPEKIRKVFFKGKLIVDRE